MNRVFEAVPHWLFIFTSRPSFINSKQALKHIYILTGVYEQGKKSILYPT